MYVTWPRLISGPDDKPKLKDVFREMFPLTAQWMSLGMHLEIPNQVLDEIKSEKRPMDDLREMLSEWLKQSDPRPT